MIFLIVSGVIPSCPIEAGLQLPPQSNSQLLEIDVLRAKLLDEIAYQRMDLAANELVVHCRGLFLYPPLACSELTNHGYGKVMGHDAAPPRTVRWGLGLDETHGHRKKEPCIRTSILAIWPRTRSMREPIASGGGILSARVRA